MKVKQHLKEINYLLVQIFYIILLTYDTWAFPT